MQPTQQDPRCMLSSAPCRHNRGIKQSRLCCSCHIPFQGKSTPQLLAQYIKPLPVPYLHVPFSSVLHDKPNTALVRRRGSRVTLALKLSSWAGTIPCSPCTRSVCSLGFPEFSTAVAYTCIQHGSTDDRPSSGFQYSLRTKYTSSCASVIKRSSQH